MRAGKLRHQVTITERNVTGEDSYGQDTLGVPTTIGTFRCELTALRGRELETAQQTWGDARFKIRMRYPSGITIKREHTATIGSRAFDILDAEDPTGRRRELIIYAKEFTE
jgi:head-tail adaptor